MIDFCTINKAIKLGTFSELMRLGLVIKVVLGNKMSQMQDWAMAFVNKIKAIQLIIAWSCILICSFSNGIYRLVHHSLVNRLF